MTVGDTLTCHVDTLAYGGDGLARFNGQVVFVPETAPGETALVRVTQVKRNYARAQLVDLLAASPDRIDPCCRVTDADGNAPVRVPGCVYDHLDYAAEVRAKQVQLDGFLRRLPGRVAPPVLPPVASPSPVHYRNKIVLHAVRSCEGTRLGYRLEPSHRVLDIRACPFACEPINSALAGLRASTRFSDLPHEARVTFRHTAHDGALWWTDDRPSGADVPEHLTEASPVGPLLVPYDGFYQVNPAASDRLVRTVAEVFAATPDAPEILDLYCGVGVFGFACLAAGGGRLTGIESGRSAVAAARLNAAALGMTATFHCHALGQEHVALDRFTPAPRRTTALLDPPRDGLAPGLCQSLAASGIARILYVSCDPATLARDLAILLAGGRYRLLRARLFDLFPRTAHFETLVELART